MKISGSHRRAAHGLEGSRNARGLRFAVAVSAFNGSVTENLLKHCLASLRQCGTRDKDVAVVRVPGAFELPLVCNQLARSRRYDAVIALGCILRGETTHDRYLAQETARGLGQTALSTGVPVLFGVITPLNIRQAKARSGPGRLNKGRELGVAAVETANLLKILKKKKGRI